MNDQRKAEIRKAIRNRVEEVGDCWIWQQGVTACGYPQMNVAGFPTKMVRRMAAMLAGHEMKKGQPVEMTCCEKLCVNPAHTQPSTTKKVAQNAAARGAFSTTQRSARIAAARRLGIVKLTDDQVAEIRASSEPETKIAPRMGVHKSYIGRIRRNEARRDYSNPFAGLGAR